MDELANIYLGEAVGDAIGLVVVFLVVLLLLLLVGDLVGAGDALATVVEVFEVEAFAGELAEAGMRKALNPTRLLMAETMRIWLSRFIFLLSLD